MSEVGVTTASVPSGSTLIPHNPRARRLRSKVWNDFSKERLSDGSFVAICHHCGKQLTASSRSGTTHLKNHLLVCLNTGTRPARGRRRKLVVRRVLLKQPDSNSNTDPIATDSSLTFDQETSRYDLALMVIRHGYRFSIVEDLGFRHFISHLQPGFQIPVLETVQSDCMQIYHSTRLKLKTNLSNLKSRVSLSADMWRSAVNIGTEYLSLSCHYIDHEWRLKKKILNFVPLEPGYTGTDIASKVLEKLHEWGIENKVMSVVLDNCLYSDEAGPELVTALSVGTKFEIYHVRSCVYVLNFIIQESLELVRDLTDRVRASIRFVKSSQTRYMRFQEAVKQLGIGNEKQKPAFLSHDTSNYKNTWTSLCLMLESVCPYQDAFIRLYEWDPEYRAYVTPDDWPAVLSLFECLHELYVAMDKLPNVENPTSNQYFLEICDIHLILKKWCTNTNNRYKTIALMSAQMLQKFEEYWDTNKTLMAFASILDPRYKTKSVEYFFKVIYKEDPYEAKTQINTIKNQFIHLYNSYASMLKTEPIFYKGTTTTNTPTTNNNNPSNLNDLSNAKTFSQITISDARRGLDQYLEETSTGQVTKSDLDLYLEEAVLRSKEELGLGFDVLVWWRVFEEKYPVLAAMARDLLGVGVAGGVEEEGRVLNDYLSGMDERTVQGLICAQDWLRDNDDQAKNMDAETAVPNDMDGAGNNANVPMITN